jgi:hypothetical protein
MFRNFGPWETVILTGVCWLIFGARLPGVIDRNLRGGGPRAGA